MTPLLPDVIVNGTPIPAARIAAEAQNHPAPPGKPGLAWRAAARALVLRELMLQEAQARGLQPDPRAQAPDRIETDEESLLRQVIEIAVAPDPVDEGRLRATYDASPERFRAPTLYEASHILFAAAPDDPAARAEALAQAHAVAAILRAEPHRFGDLARHYSACASAQSGGRMGQIVAGDTVPEFEAALDRMDEGEISAEPVTTRFGLHILRLDARAPGAVLPWSVVAPRLRAAAEKAAWVKASRDFARQLADNARIEGIALDSGAPDRPPAGKVAAQGAHP